MRRLGFALLAWLLLAPVDALAQREGAATGAPSLKDQFVGTWRLVSTEQRNAKGEVVPRAAGAAERTGYIIYDPAGYMAVSIMPVGRKKYAGLQATEAEALSAINAYAGYFGTFTIDATAKTVTHHLQGSLDPGMAPDQVRRFELTGNRITLKPPPAANGNQSALTWERMPDLASPTAEQRKFFGFWKLVSNERKNQKGEILASNPGQTGYIIYTPAGFMMVHMVQPNRRKYAGAQPTGAEAKDVLAKYTNYFGPFIVHQTDGYVVHDQFGSVNVGRNGYGPLQRFYTFTGNRLLLQPPKTDTPEGQTLQGTITWEKAAAVSGTR